jgi:tetraprenyl-beta-curcumene synthase
MVSIGEVCTLFAAAVRQLRFGLRATSREMRIWRLRAQAAPDQPLRAALLGALQQRRNHVDGAALYCTLASSPSLRLLRLLVAYELVLDCLDSIDERTQSPQERDGRQLHTALIDAVDPGSPCQDYFGHHLHTDDGGCLRALVCASRESCASLPSWPTVGPSALGCARRTQILALNHVHPAVRDAALLRFAAGEQSTAQRNLTWFEWGAALSGEMLAIHALLVLAASARTLTLQVEATHAAYYPWTSLAATMLDSYVDQFEDDAKGCHSYVSHYASPGLIAPRLADVVRHALASARSLPKGRRHAVLVACMIAMYLTKDSTRTPQLRAGCASIVAAGGPLVQLLVPVLRTWRAAYDQRSA